MTTYQTLRQIYDKYLKMHRENPDSEQICCMWSTADPPDEIYDTDQVDDIEEAFGIAFSKDEAMEIYDMTLTEAASLINKIKRRTE